MSKLTMRDLHYVDGLEEFCRSWLRPNYVVAEIGVFAGEGSAILARHVARLICVDPWDASYKDGIFEGCENPDVIAHIRSVEVNVDRAEQAFDAVASAAGNIIKIKSFDYDIVEQIADASLDGLYIDAVHTYESVLRQLGAWRRKVRPGGVIAGHDYGPDWPGVITAVDQVFGQPDEVFVDTSWAVRQPG